MKLRIGLLIAALAMVVGGGLTAINPKPASASPCQVGPSAAWTLVSQGAYAGNVTVAGGTRWREACWTVEVQWTTATTYLMRVKIQDTVDSQEADNDGWIEARYATPGNLVWHTTWPNTNGVPTDKNSADWSFIQSQNIVGNLITDGPPSAWHVQFRIVAKNYTNNQHSYAPIVRAWG